MCVLSNIYCPLTLNYAYVFLFQSMLCSAMFYDVPLFVNADAYMSTCFQMCARNRFHVYFPMFAEVKVLQQQNMLNVHHMHTLVCRVRSRLSAKFK